MNVTAPKAWLTALCLAATSLLTGCGPWQSIPATPAVTEPGAADFTFLVTASASMFGGAAPTPFSLQINPLNGFSAAVSVAVTMFPTALPCSETNCTTIIPATTNIGQLHLAPPATASPGAYTLTFTATSGRLTHTATATLTILPPAPADFTFTVSPASNSITAGTTAPSYSFTITPVNGFASPVTVSGSAPTGFICAQSPCAVTSSATQISNALQFNLASTLTPGTYTLTFTATSGSLTHIATAALLVTAPTPVFTACGGNELAPTTPLPGVNGFVYTGAEPTASIYDSLHNVVFATNKQLGEVEVISPNTLSIIARIPVVQPEGLDLTADLSTLIVGTDASFFYRIDTSSLCVIDRISITSNKIAAGLDPAFPVALSDGSIMFQLLEVSTTENGIALWTQSGGTVPLSPGTYLGTSVGRLLRSGDHQHAFLSEADSGGYIGRYDVATQSFTTFETGFGNFANVLGSNFDGSRLYYSVNCCNLVASDQDFNTLGSISPGSITSVTLSADGSHVYTGSVNQDYITVFDASTLTTLGYLPFQQSTSDTQVAPQYLGVNYEHMDGAGRFLVPDIFGLRFAVFDYNFQSTSTAATVQAGGLSQDNFELGSTTILNYRLSAAITPTSASFSEGSITLPGTVTVTTDPVTGNGVSIVAPRFSSGCADLAARFNVGLAAFIPGAFCYAPTVYDLDGDSGPTSGGGTLTIHGKGFGPTPTVTIGGASAQIKSVGGTPSNTTAFEPEVINVLAPAGSPGEADIVITGAGGASLTLSAGYTYYTRQDVPLPSGAVAQNLLFDSAHGHLLWTDSGRNMLVIASATTGQILQQIPVGPSPLGVSVSPDGSEIAVATTGDRVVTLYNASTFTKLQSAVVPTNTPQQLAVLNNGKILITAADANALSGGYDRPYFYLYDIASNTIGLLPGLFFTPDCENFASVLATSDGSSARIGNIFYTAATGVSTPATYGGLSCTTFGLSADGAISADPSLITNSVGSITGYYNVPIELGEKIDGFPLSILTGARTFALNSSGSLAVEPLISTVPQLSTTDFVRIFETGHGSLVRTVSVPGGMTYTNFGNPLALDPNGQNIWLITPSGLTDLQFAADPLAIGEVQVLNGVINVLGSGFTSNMTLNIDGQALTPVTVTGTTSARAALPSLTPGTHSVSVTSPGRPPYTLPVGFVTP